MPIPVRTKRTTVRFRDRMEPSNRSNASPSSNTGESIQLPLRSSTEQSRLVELSDDMPSDDADVETLSANSDDYEDVPELAEVPQYPTIPSLFADYPPIQDELETQSSELQNETVKECLPFLTAAGERSAFRGLQYNENGIPRLRREEHVSFLQDALEPYNSFFSVLDASRPWIFYWALNGLATLGEDVTTYGDRYVILYKIGQTTRRGVQSSHAD